ncbi:phosphatidylinositol 3-kinase regulatory subunit alpha-like isoform X2 [Asterias amurensis]|uniref:phosphatidylinositol 3-kinase regulatory subunit alpha-like isoform X2 n=1 Tax=Asterias amurensis TaxID=7602 RepID=UPI003AB1C4E5
MEETVRYIAAFPYKKKAPQDIEMQEGDIMQVKNPTKMACFKGTLEEPTGWLEGVNMRTQERGIFPGTFVKYFVMPQEVPRVDVMRDSADSITRQSITNSGNGHRLVEQGLVTPVLCKHCNDYVWGTGKIGLQCEDCNLMYHRTCGQYANNYECNKNLSGYTQTNREMPMLKWTVENVLNWMAVTHLYRYADVFKKHQIDGQYLMELNLEKLEAIGIKDDFNQQCILYTRDELVKGDSRQHGVKSEPVTEVLYPSSQHKLQPSTFSTLQWCDQCRKFMYGMTHQGLRCTTCRLVCHKSCAAVGLAKCDSSHFMSRQQLFHSGNIFGVELSEQFTLSQPAPPFIIKCIEAIEHHGLEIQGLYRLPCTMLEINELKSRFAQKLDSVDLNGISNVHCITGLVKHYLRMLPNPVIEYEMYNDFMCANAIYDEPKRLTKLLECVSKMQYHHRCTLSYIMAHLCRICQLNTANNIFPKHLASVFCHSLLKPPHDKIMHVIHNMEAHKRLLVTLIEQNEYWGVQQRPPIINPSDVPPVPPRPSQPSLSSEPRTIEEAEWYWGDISREDVNEKMKDMPDGTFLVRDASNNPLTGDYTLTLRKGGSNKLIKICHSNGRYGFSEPLRFVSVVELIQHYGLVPLSQYNAKLDIKLTLPVSKKDATIPDMPDGNIDMVINKLKDKNREYLEKTRQYDELYEEYSKSLQTIQLKRQALEAFNETVTVFTEQQELHERYHKDCLPQEREQLMENFALLQQRLGEIVASRKALEEELKMEVDANRERDRTMNSIKPQILDLRKLRDQYVMWLGTQGVKQDKINAWLSMENLDNESSTDSDSLPHHNESLWLSPTVTRAEAEALLWGKAKGTFLIRQTRQGIDWACSIVAKANGEVRHCKINHTQTGYGFAEPYNLYSSLKELVLAYQQNPLTQHNEELDTTLAYPVYGPQPPPDMSLKLL